MPPRSDQVVQHAAPVLILISGAWALFAALCMSPEWLGVICTVDDTYLALEVARRWAQVGFPTFDGIHQASGFQPLWGLILYGLAKLNSDNIALLRATVAVAALANLATGFLLIRLGRALAPDNRSMPLAIAAAWAGYCLSGQPALIGLENALLPMLLVLGMHTVLRLHQRPKSMAAWTALALVCVAVVWTRLDAVIFAGGLFVAALAISRSALPNSGVICAVLIGLSGAAGYVAFEQWAGGENTPISGLAKRAIAEHGGTFDATVAGWAHAAADAGHMLLKHAMIGIGCGTPRPLANLGRVLLGLLVAGALLGARPRPRAWIFMAIAVTFAHALLLRVWLGRTFFNTAWYYSGACMLAALGVPFLFLVWDCRLLLQYRHPGRAGRAALPLCARLLSLVFVVRLGYSGWLLLQPPPTEHVSVVRIAAGRWLREQLAPGERIAAWNAGELAYFSERTVINLDGLMNDREFLNRFVRRGESLTKYLGEQQVQWVIDYVKGAQEQPGMFWSTLPDLEWQEVRRFGQETASAQLLVQRRKDRDE